MSKGIEEVLGAFWIPCFLHQIHNSITSGLQVIDTATNVIAFAKTFVTFLRQSPKQMARFRVIQKDVIAGNNSTRD